MDKNPFVISGYAGDRYFCDRERETEMLKEYVANGINVTLISPRRIGKTGGTSVRPEGDCEPIRVLPH